MVGDATTVRDLTFVTIPGGIHGSGLSETWNTASHISRSERAIVVGDLINLIVELTPAQADRSGQQALRREFGGASAACRLRPLYAGHGMVTACQLREGWKGQSNGGVAFQTARQTQRDSSHNASIRVCDADDDQKTDPCTNRAGDEIAGLASAGNKRLNELRCACT